MARYPMRFDFADKPQSKPEILNPREQYHQTLVEKNRERLIKALSIKHEVVMVVAMCNYVWVFFSLGHKDLIYASFEEACELLPGKLFYHPIRGTVVNLAHLQKFTGKGRNTRIVMPYGWDAKMNRDEIKKLSELKMYLASNEFITARKRQLV
jgi:hypothetical protein